jgi:release factor glutamine methyltransferase
MEKPRPATVKLMLEEYRRVLGKQYLPDEIRHLFYTLAEAYLGWSKTTVHLEGDFRLSPEICDCFLSALDRLAASEPVQYITGTCLFNGHVFMVRPGVLIPRPETEELCGIIAADQAAGKYCDLSLLDMGTGSGCIAIDLAFRLPYARVTAIDSSVEALDLARLNAERLGATVHFIRCDLLDSEDLRQLGTFDLIVSNPPYVTSGEKSAMKENVLGFEPHSAIFVPGNDPLLFYRSIVSFAARHLNRPGSLYLEINERFGKEVSELLRINGFEEIGISRDLSGRDRFVKGWLVRGVEDVSYWYDEKQ